MNENKLFEEELINAVDLEAAPPTEEPERQYYYIAKARKYVKELSEKLGRPLFAHVTTFGCQMNARDSEKLVGILEQIGYVEGTDEHSDLLYTTPVQYVRMLTTRCMAGLDICRTTRKRIL